MLKDCEDFINNFSIVENAMNMRTLLRWNGRDLRTKENLAEHTHLVTACVIELYDELNWLLNSKYDIRFEKIIRLAMLHDSLELLRGDILSVTKDIIPTIRDFTDKEEMEFLVNKVGVVTQIEEDLVKLADLKACYKFIEYELRYPSNDFAINVYQTTKKKFDEAYYKFLETYTISDVRTLDVDLRSRFVKGYEDDAGCDVILEQDVTFMPMSTTKFDLGVHVTPSENEMSFLCSRTSAAAKGLIVAMCPIDPNFNGTVTAIVHNLSNDIIEYRKGEAFCQVVTTPIKHIVKDVYVKKEGRRSSGKLGSTGK